MNIYLKKIDSTNWEDCINLHVGPTQTGFILPNVNSLAEWSVKPDAHAYGIFNDDKIVGFAMFQKDDEGIYDIHRYMIDFAYQGKGIGLKALEKLVELIISLSEDIDKIKIMFLVENLTAEKLYKKAGFIDSNKTLYNEKWRFTEKIFYYYRK
ncbi:GNAT family N-acetyltransferase [Mucilaginibacter psychrotolerans]|uniref:GNAT family N-acetyltransferase n=1 Tax=Mucilaginibacter psychrotolerans TaxID=1524096 RepID=A0A4Y8SGX0_9SPHI|nr:GNAT family N-acetyltransferase [Mucilaginibacter psychrotolerans]TFF37931.1 GNAT family N-acetyltransferase [Mucilaginibacter psychrotolerans]